MGQAVGDVGQGAGQEEQQQGGQEQQGGGQGLEGLTGQLGQAAGGVTDQVGQVGQLAGGLTGGGQQGGGNGGAPDPGAGQLAKVVVKTVAHEIGSAASDEVKDLGSAAARKAKDLGERRRQRRAEKHNATPAALKAAQEEGIDLDDIEGSGADGRITVKDVREAIEA